MGIRRFVRALPFVGRIAKRPATAKAAVFSTSGAYWEQRYRTGGHSGAGSYNRLGLFKADVLNGFVAANQIRSVIEFGSGDGAQLRLALYPSYTGVDVSHTVLERTRAAFAHDPSIRFLHASEVGPDTKADLALSLDVIYHLVEDDIYDAYMRQLFDAALRFVIVYASNEDKGWPVPHVRHRRFTDWVERHRPDFALVERLPNRYPYDPADARNTSFADFFVFRRA
ncbi:methyltransferase domain-containing protein [Marinivivus vitaminiproducens]|uniref:methyltransferase domain-containing protein n=1 Tax=Marinivivus vitaminiproducens TaxID=3035935 RepID=UPI0027A9039E|nr:class I SAM-dependent methyltransferase [Geminicoccaceae bacterium SCSIO 64248]